jgi:hypothetical protein
MPESRVRLPLKSPCLRNQRLPSGILFQPVLGNYSNDRYISADSYEVLERCCASEDEGPRLM